MVQRVYWSNPAYSPGNRTVARVYQDFAKISRDAPRNYAYSFPQLATIISSTRDAGKWMRFIPGETVPFICTLKAAADLPQSTPATVTCCRAGQDPFTGGCNGGVSPIEVGIQPSSTSFRLGAPLCTPFAICREMMLMWILPS